MNIPLAKAEPALDEQNKQTHFDVLIVGAGVSGVGAAHHLQEQCPDKNFVILETMGTHGGTWYSHKYPGIRSDSDLYTFGYRFKPWTCLGGTAFRAQHGHPDRPVGWRTASDAAPSFAYAAVCAVLFPALRVP